MADEELSRDEDAALAVLCLTNAMCGPMGAMMVTMELGGQETKEAWLEALGGIRGTLADIMAQRIKDGKTTPEEEEHFSRHINQINAVVPVG